MVRHALAQAPVRSRLVVVLDELAEYVLQMPPAADQEMVEKLTPDGPDPPFGECVRPVHVGCPLWGEVRTCLRSDCAPALASP